MYSLVTKRVGRRASGDHLSGEEVGGGHSKVRRYRVMTLLFQRASGGRRFPEGGAIPGDEEVEAQVLKEDILCAEAIEQAGRVAFLSLMLHGDFLVSVPGFG